MTYTLEQRWPLAQRKPCHDRLVVGQDGLSGPVDPRIGFNLCRTVILDRYRAGARSLHGAVLQPALQPRFQVGAI